jgi:pimeloyl-ACP methyl ester carboxylesterase
LPGSGTPNGTTAEEEAMRNGTAARVGTDRFSVRSSDGTPLAVWVDGAGPPLVLVHGSLSDHTTFEPLVHELRDAVRTFSMDRRGFGASGDAAGYSIEREFEDVSAVVAAVAARTGSPVALWGHSYGAGCAMGGAARTGDVGRLVLYEPVLGIAYPAGSIEEVEAAVAAGDVEAAVVAVLLGILEMTVEDVDALRASPRWPVLLAAGPTVPRECLVEHGWVYRPGQFDAIAAPTLLLAGSEPTRAQGGHPSSGGGDPRPSGPVVGGAWPPRPQDRSRHGRSRHPAVHLHLHRVRLVAAPWHHDRPTGTPERPVAECPGRVEVGARWQRAGRRVGRRARCDGCWCHWRWPSSSAASPAPI